MREVVNCILNARHAIQRRGRNILRKGGVEFRDAGSGILYLICVMLC